MAVLADLIANGTPVEAHRPWPRVVVDADGWRAVDERAGATAR